MSRPALTGKDGGVLGFAALYPTYTIKPTYTLNLRSTQPAGYITTHHHPPTCLGLRADDGGNRHIPLNSPSE